MDVASARVLGAGRALLAVERTGERVVAIKAGDDAIDRTQALAAVHAADAASAQANASEQANEAAPSRFVQMMDNVTDRVGAHVASGERFVSRWEIGKRAVAIARSEPEKVQTTFDVELTLASGRSVTMPVTITDAATTKLLRRLSLTAETGSYAPLCVGHVIAAGASVASALASIGARIAGNKPLAQSLQGMAAKHLLIAIPIIGHAAGGIAAVVNNEGLKKSRGASVQDVVELGA